MAEPKGFPERLSDAIAQSGMNQKELAKHLGVREATVSNWVKGRSSPELAQLERLPDALGVSGHWLLTEEGDPKPPRSAEGGPHVAIGMIEEALTILRREIRSPGGVDPDLLKRARAETDRRRADAQRGDVAEGGGR